jgi:DNA helicase-2/ATP-dependent DNA helicase PcrA
MPPSQAVIQPRDSQEKIRKYRRGRMGVAAVPGSGKTWTLSLLAADLIKRGALAEDQEVLVVTLVNSAVDNFYSRVSSFIQTAGFLPHTGYRVRTLHGLAHDIVRERPDLAGLEQNFQIIDEREASAILKESVQAWLRSHPYELESYYLADLDDNRRDWLNREKLPDLVSDVALAVIRYAKDQQLTPDRLVERLDNLRVPLPLLEMGADIYSLYQRALLYRGAVDFDDLIRLALGNLQSDNSLLERLRHRWPYILEDEAQDSSRLQEEILSLLSGAGAPSGAHGNWVRVGDPNQAIYETFTTANPQYLRDFLNSKGVLKRSLPESGRSTTSIIALANYLARWTKESHPLETVRNALDPDPAIRPTPPDDPQPNPPDDPKGVHLVLTKFTAEEEVNAVAASVAKWLPDHPQATLAVLVLQNNRADRIAEELRRRGLEVVDSLLRSTQATRLTSGALTHLLRFLSNPTSARYLAQAYRVWRREERQEIDEARLRMERTSELLRKCDRVEDFLWPGAERDWLEETGLAETDPAAYEQLSAFRRLARRWQTAVLLPVDQVLLTLAQDIFTQPSELALAHKLANLLRQASQGHPSWGLKELTAELGVIARNERRFIGFSDDDQGFDPQQHKGKAIVATMHKAKGLEFDRVYLMSVNNYDFPSGEEYDAYYSEKWFIRDQLNLQAEALAQLQLLRETSRDEWYQEGHASRQDRLNLVRERLRLLYVGITRARRQLIITYNTGRRGEARPATPLVELYNYWERQQAGN